MKIMRGPRVSSRARMIGVALVAGGLSGLAFACRNSAERASQLSQSTNVTPRTAEATKPCPTFEIRPVAWRIIDVTRDSKGVIVEAEMDEILSNGNYTRYSVDFVKRTATWRTPAGEMGVPGPAARGGWMGEADGSAAEAEHYLKLILKLFVNINEQMFPGRLPTDASDLKAALEWESNKILLSEIPEMAVYYGRGHYPAYLTIKSDKIVVWGTTSGANPPVTYDLKTGEIRFYRYNANKTPKYEEVMIKEGDEHTALLQSLLARINGVLGGKRMPVRAFKNDPNGKILVGVWDASDFAKYPQYSIQEAEVVLTAVKQVILARQKK